MNWQRLLRFSHMADDNPTTSRVFLGPRHFVVWLALSAFAAFGSPARDLQVDVISQTCVPRTEVEVKVTRLLWFFYRAPAPGTRVEILFPAGGSQSAIADGGGIARLSGPPTDAFDLKAGLAGWRTVRKHVECSPVPRFGFLPYHIYTLRIPPGHCPHPNPSITGCDNTGDTLPTGSQKILYLFGVFDTGSTIVGINNSPRPTGGVSDSQALALCQLNAPCQIPPNAAQHDPYLPIPLDVRIWGLGAVDATTLGAPLATPQLEAQGLQVRPMNGETLIGAPVAAKAIAVIDYGTTVSRTFWFGRMDAPDITFFSGGAAGTSGASGAPSATYQFPLNLHGSFTTAVDGATVGPRFTMPTAAFRNGANTVTGQNYQILYDTGNATTQVSERVAATLGINTNAVPPIDTPSINTVSDGTVRVRGYMIDQFDMTTADGSNQYTIRRPMIYVRANRPNGQSPFPDNADIVVGSNYFWKLKVVFNGPGATLGLFVLHP